MSAGSGPDVAGGTAIAGKVHRIPAGAGRAFRLLVGQTVELLLPEGPQVADTWAFRQGDMAEFLSTEHTRSCLDRLTPRVGDAFFSNRRNSMLTIVRDTTAGRHDMLLSACDVARYRLLGHEGYHANCVDNLGSALADLGLVTPEIPSPVNIFENVSIDAEGGLQIEPPQAEAGQSITLCAEMDLVLVVSACPMDIVPTNGADRRPKPVDVTIRAAGSGDGK